MLRDDTIELVCVADANYAPHLAVLLKSIEANKGAEHVRVHAILDGVDASLFNQIRSTVPRLNIIAYNVAGHVALDLPPLLQISRATYLRLIITEVLPATIDRVLYLDIDMVVTCSLLALWQTDLQGHSCGAVEDPGVDADTFAQTYKLKGKGRYFNAGMLLINMQAAHRTSFLTRALNQLIAKPKMYEFADQDALNEQLWQNWLSLDAQWNYQREHLYKPEKYITLDPINKFPSIIHFTESQKPWKFNEWHPHAWLYWRHLRNTPFFSVVCQRNNVKMRHIFKFWLKYRLSLMRGKLFS